MNLSGKKNQVLVTTVPQEAKGGIAALHQILFESPLKKKFDLLPFFISSRAPFKESLPVRLLRVFSGANLLFWRLIKASSIKIIHVNTAPDTKAILRDALLVFVSKSLKRKIVMQVHGAVKDYHNPKLVDWIAAKAYSASDKILVFSAGEKAEIGAIVPEDKIEILPNAVKVNDFKSGGALSFRSDWGIKADSRIVLFLSRFVETKGVYDIIDVIPRITERYKETVFVFAGDGPEKDKMMECCRLKGVEQYVRFTGYLGYQEVLRAFSSADIFVLPTYGEGMPMAVIQALAAGLPIVSTRVGAIPEMIQDGLNGFLFQPRDLDAFADRLLTLLGNGELRKKMKSENMNLAKRRFDVKVMSGKLDDLYSGLLKPGRDRRQ